MNYLQVLNIVLIFMRLNGLIIRPLHFERLQNNLTRFPSIVYFEHVMNTSDVVRNVTTDKLCTCKELCHQSRTCLTLSLKKNPNGNVLCSFSNKQISSLSLRYSRMSFTFAIHNNDSIFLGNDGLFYVLQKTEYDREGGKNYCDTSYQNGRLVIPKTKVQADSVREYLKSTKTRTDSPYFVIDLIYDPMEGLIWGDGTKYSDSEMKDHEITAYDGPSNDIRYFKCFLAVVNKINNTFSIQGVNKFPTLSYAACQLDPLGIH